MSETYLYGFHAITRRLEQSPRLCEILYCTERRNPRLLKLIDNAKNAGLAVVFENREQLATRCGSEKHQGCVLKTRLESPSLSFEQLLDSISASSLLLVLDGVQDPHNLGACLRTADACGIDALILSKDRSVGLNATVRKVAAGAAETVPVIEVTNLARCLKRLKQAGVWIYGTSDAAESSLYDHDYSGPVALVMGAEGTGLRRLTMAACDYLVKLPMLGRVESLNVSVAAGVCLYEILRSRAFAR